MSFIDRTKNFFGLGPMDFEEDDAYYNDEPRYAGNGAATSAAYAPRRAPQAYEPTPAPVLSRKSSSRLSWQSP